LFGLARIRYTGAEVQTTPTIPERDWMSELSERRWAVQSERGSEAAGLTYEEAAALVRRLRGERMSGLCVITEEAARLLPPAKQGNGKRPEEGRGPKRPRRGMRKSAT
jgi:hypothetical protein